jgi:hypothetical protein
MVRTSKADVMRQLCAYDLNSRKLWKWPAYQKFNENAVEEKGNDSYVLRHIRGSIAKWPKVCQILAAEREKEINIHHKFSSMNRLSTRFWVQERVVFRTPSGHNVHDLC